MTKRIVCGLLAATMLVVTTCGCTGGTSAKKANYGFGDEILTFLTNGEVRFKLQDDDYVKVYDKSELDEKDGIIINIDPSKTYQTIEGFGASFTETSAYLMDLMTEEQRQDVMTKLFDREKGIGISLIRNTIAPSDFTPVEYASYDDMPEGENDFNLEHFDMSAAESQIKYTKAAIAINKDIKVFLSPWSAPRWMKTKYSWYAIDEPKLRRECYDVYARYLVKCVQGYEKNGVNIYGITAQNEPFTRREYPGMDWTWENLATFTNDYFRPALNDAGLKTKIFNLDYNFSRKTEGENIMAATLDSADGIGYHFYSGDPEVIKDAVAYFPNKEVWVTEASGGKPENVTWFMRNTTQCLRSIKSGAKGYILWNLVLNPIGGPNWTNDYGGNVHGDCTGLVTYDDKTGELTYPDDYYAVAHFSKYILPGAKLVESTDTGVDSEYKYLNMVSLNENGTMVINAINSDPINDMVYKFVLGDKVLEIKLAKRDVVTMVWDAN